MTTLDEATTSRSTLILVVIDNKYYMSVPKTARDRTEYPWKRQKKRQIYKFQREAKAGWQGNFPIVKALAPPIGIPWKPEEQTTK